MNTTDGLYVGIKLLGIYFLCITVKDIPSALGAIGLTAGGEADDSAGVLALYLASTVIVLIIGLLLTFKTNSLLGFLSADKDSLLSASTLTIGGALKLLGVYLAVTSMARVISNVGMSFTNSSSLIVKISLYGPSVFTCIVGLLLALKGQYIWGLISERDGRV